MLRIFNWAFAGVGILASAGVAWFLGSLILRGSDGKRILGALLALVAWILLAIGGVRALRRSGGIEQMWLVAAGAVFAAWLILDQILA